jgi:drug/metabolite transporter (DMT)-like permease
MRNGWLIAAGALITIAGVVWALQGFGVVGGSFMSGNSIWAIIGPLVALAGLAIAAVGVRRLRASARASAP